MTTSNHVKNLTYLECNLCRCSWSGYVDIEEAREHYSEDHPEVDQDTFIDISDYMTRKTVKRLTSRK